MQIQDSLNMFEQQQDEQQIKNNFFLSDDEKDNINKILPRGFHLIKINEILNNNNRKFEGKIQFIPQKKQLKIASEEIAKQFPLQNITSLIKSQIASISALDVGNKIIGNNSYNQLPEGRSRQTQKVKKVFQKFRKHPKYVTFSQRLSKIGFLSAISEIQAESKRNIHTIDSFKDRMMIVFNKAKEVTYAQDTNQLITEMIDEFLFYVEQERKSEFQCSLQSIQTSIDKITRQITSIKETGNWYFRKKKRNQVNFEQKQLQYIVDLIKILPVGYLVGVWEIIEEKPFMESSLTHINFNLAEIKQKKIRQIKFYVKKKLQNYCKSRQRNLNKKLKKNLKQIQKQKQKLKRKQIQQQGKKNKQKQNQKQLGKKIQKSIQQQQHISNEQKIQSIEGRQQMNQKNPSENSHLFESVNDSQMIQFNEEISNFASDIFDDNKSKIKSQKNRKDININHFKDEEIKVIPIKNQKQIQFISLPYLDVSSDSSMITDEQDSQLG